MHHIPICSDVIVVDTTGAGDAYCAGFVTAKSRGSDDLMACRVGMATAGLCCIGLSSDAGNTSWESTVKFMEEFFFFLNQRLVYNSTKKHILNYLPFLSFDIFNLKKIRYSNISC